MATTSPLLRVPLPQSSDTDQVPADLLTQTQFAETYWIGRFASAAERTTYLTAAGLGTGVRGMLSDNAATGRPERFDGTNWLPLVPSKTVPGSAIKGTAYTSDLTVIEYRFSYVATTNSAGGFTIPFPTAFPNGLASVQFTQGDTYLAALWSVVGLVNNHTLAQGQGVAYLPGGGAIVSANIRVEVTATGW